MKTELAGKLLDDAQANLAAWSPSPFSGLLRTDTRGAYESLLSHPTRALGLLEERLKTAVERGAKTQHIQNLEAPGGCWELGNQLNPSRDVLITPEGQRHHLFTYRLVYIIYNALVLEPDDHVRHLCNNRACIRPDHLLVGSHQQNIQDDERRIYAGNSPKGRGQALHGHVHSGLQKRPDPFVSESLAREENASPSNMSTKKKK